MIVQPAQIRCLASPIRQEIVDAVAATGPLSIADLARHLGRAADGLYFHVRALARVGLLIEQSSVRRGKRFAAVFDVPARPLVIEKTPARATSIGRVVASALRLAARDTNRALKNRTISTQGPYRTLSAGRVKGWLSATDRKRINALLDELLMILRSARPGPGRLLHAFTYVSAPPQLSIRATRAKENSHDENK